MAASAKGPPFPPFPAPVGVQEAIAALGDRLPEVAMRYGKSAERLQELFQQNNDLWLDPNETLVYFCSFATGEGEALAASGTGEVASAPLPSGIQTFLLHSRPGASKVIYLDFDGHVTSGTILGTAVIPAVLILSPGHLIPTATARAFSNDELDRIQEIWTRVAEDFAMYDVDVTTEDPGTEALRRATTGDQYYGVRVVISPSSGWFSSAGGVAYVGSFNWSSDTPAFIFSDRLSNNAKYVAEAASHETGHTLSLYHDGTTDGTEYYAGHGDWAPIMGVGYSKKVTQWSRGEYVGANNTEDDLAEMLSEGISYNADDHGDWINNATPIAGATISVSGVIDSIADMDVFSFQAEAGTVSINADPAAPGPNLDILLQLLDSGGNIIAEDDPDGVLPVLSAGINATVPAGTYYILIDGVGTSDPTAGYPDYGSLGQYTISGTIPWADIPPDAPSALTASAMSSSGIQLHWTDNADNENGFTIERSPNGYSWQEVGFTAADTTTYADTGLTPQTPYFYRVAAYNLSGASAYSNTASATTMQSPPQAPGQFWGLTNSSSYINLYWSSVENATGFRIQRSLDNITWTEIVQLAATYGTYTDTGLKASTTYHYRIFAFNNAGSSDAKYASVLTSSDTSTPAAPTSLAATAVSASQINLSWNDNSTNENGFRVERLNGSTWAQIAQLAANVTHYSNTGYLHPLPIPTGFPPLTMREALLSPIVLRLQLKLARHLQRPQAISLPLLSRQARST